FQSQREARRRSISVETRSVASMKELVTRTAWTGSREDEFPGSFSSRAEIRGARRYCSLPAFSANSGFSAMMACAHLRIGVVERRFLERTTSLDSGNAFWNSSKAPLEAPRKR